MVQNAAIPRSPGRPYFCPQGHHDELDSAGPMADAHDDSAQEIDARGEAPSNMSSAAVQKL